jgi:hypothetical protein
MIHANCGFGVERLESENMPHRWLAPKLLCTKSKMIIIAASSSELNAVRILGEDPINRNELTQTSSMSSISIESGSIALLSRLDCLPVLPIVHKVQQVSSEGKVKLGDCFFAIVAIVAIIVEGDRNSRTGTGPGSHVVLPQFIRVILEPHSSLSHVFGNLL